MKNKNLIRLIPLMVVLGLIFLANKCEKDDPPPDWRYLTDGDGNTYYAIRIETQHWLAKNLMTTKLNDKTPIQVVTDPSAWASLTTPACCFYNNDSGNKDTYGVLYNWYAVNTGKLCPTKHSMRVPTDDDFTTLINFIGEFDAGSRLKEPGLTHWASPNSPTPNPTEIKALPGGVRSSNGTFNDITFTGSWWTSTEVNADNAWSRHMYYDLPYVGKEPRNKKSGFSVRCLWND